MYRGKVTTPAQCGVMLVQKDRIRKVIETDVFIHIGTFYVVKGHPVEFGRGRLYVPLCVLLMTEQAPK